MLVNNNEYLDIVETIKAIPHNYFRAIAQSDFSSDCTMRTTQGCMPC